MKTLGDLTRSYYITPGAAFNCKQFGKTVSGTGGLEKNIIKIWGHIQYFYRNTGCVPGYYFLSAYMVKQAFAFTRQVGAVPISLRRNQAFH
jgi:hypothetical protein